MLSKLRDWDVITEEDIQVVEGFVCAMYGNKRFQSVDELHLELFLKKYKPKFFQAENSQLKDGSL